MVLEVNLHNLIGESEHYSVPCAHPLLHVDDVLDATLSALNLIRHLCVRIWLLGALKVASEVLQKRDFLLQVFWVVCESVLASDILPISASSLHVVEVEAVWIEANLR